MREKNWNNNLEQQLSKYSKTLPYLAPGEGQRPLGIFKDKFIEEMNFPTLFYGDPHGIDITE